jgi:hypothetical protein
MPAIITTVISFIVNLFKRSSAPPVTEPVENSDPVTVETGSHTPTVPVTVDVTVTAEDKPATTEFSSQQDD